MKKIAAQAFIEEELGGKGYQYATTHIKRITPLGVLVTREAVRKAIRELDLEGHEIKTAALHQDRLKFRVPGLNTVWLVDGYDKLSIFRFQIYGIIDAYF